ncbi:hypothetical protein B0H21DRAFT_317936 [Amylocystis lapponica]|nr:hypothetical protein B0H21DRAFT_317936 [Amylocystis lapponica]
MLPTPISSRRSSARLSKELSERPMMSPPNNGSRWRFNGTGQLIDSASQEWDIADEIVKLQIGVNDEVDGSIRTPPQSKAAAAAMVQMHETSPLETASEDSLDSNSSNPLDQSGNLASHSRGSSADTTGSALSGNSQTLRAPPYTPLKVGAVGESRNRPHSYSGGLSSADLVLLQQAGGSSGETWTPPNGTPERSQQVDQPTYPSLAGGRQEQQQTMPSGPRPDDFQVDYQMQQRQFSPLHQAPGAAPNNASPPSGYAPARANNVAANMPFRQVPRGFNPQVQVPPVLQSPTNFGYPALHTAPMPINSTQQQQLYEMMLPTPPLENPTMARLQQQHGVFRPTHQHSASDPASLRDPAAMALLNNNIQAFAASQMYPTMPPPAALSMFNQFYGQLQEPYASDMAMMARLQAQYTGPYSMSVPGQNGGGAAPGGMGSISPLGNGPSANNRKLGLYKTELCRSWEEKGSCRYGAKCQFAHGEEELRKVSRHPKYKTEICRTFWVSGSCPYGKRCCFIHTELPASGAPPGADGAPPPTIPDGRARSSSTNSDPNDVSNSSLLARISAKRTQEGTINSGSGSVSTTPPSTGYQINGRPGALRVDTSVLDAASNSKQNKSAYPTFAHNGILMPAGEEATARSPGPVTAGPDFGRHAASRMDIVGSQQRMNKTSSGSNVRHSFNGSEVQLDFSSTTTPTATNSQQSQLTSSPPEPPKSASRINGHMRSGSAGNWGSTTRANHLTAYPLSSIPGGELKTNSPWADYPAGSRLAEKSWV